MIGDQTYITMPARIVEYFKDTQTATIQLSAERLFGNSGVESTAKLRKPLLEVPVHTLSGGGWAMTMPIKAGNTCIMWFSQVGYDHWFYDNKDEAGTLAGLPKPWLRRQFSKDDGFALVGMNPIPAAIKKYTDDGSQWRNEDATQHIHLKDDLSIVIDSPISITINAPAVVVNCETADINATTKLTVDSPESQFTGNVAIDGTLDVAQTATVVGLITGLGGLGVSGGSGAAVSGNMAVSGGDLTTDQDVVAGTISLTSHTHNENGTGGGVTDGPN